MSEAIKNQKIASQEPFIFDNNWGTWGRLPQDANQLTTTNADGEPVVPLTEEQKFIFDTQGWLVIPGLLNEIDLNVLTIHGTSDRWVPYEQAVLLDEKLKDQHQRADPI